MNEKNGRRILALLLAGAAVLGSGTALVSCGESSSAEQSEKPSTETVSQKTAETEEPTETVFRYQADLPAELDYEGTAFNIYTYDDSNDTWYDVDFAATEENGELLNDATFRRMIAVEQLLNIDIVANPGPSNGSGMRKSIQAQDGAYDIGFVDTRDASSMAQKGFLIDMKSMDTLDLSQPWWDQNAVKDLTIGNRLFMMTGDISIMHKKSICAIAFNKMLANQNDLENPFDVVAQNHWTVDKFIEMARTVSKDLNGDGKYGPEDQFGLLFYCDAVALGMIGAGVKYTEKDADDYPTNTFYNQRTQSVWEKYTELMFNKQLCFSWTWPGYGDYNTAEMFSANQGLFFTTEMHAIEIMRSMEADFGILPFPKYDEEQERYYHIINPHCAAMLLIPKDCPDVERTGCVLDALGAASKNILTPAYYELYLKTKGARDNDSEAMLDIIFDTLTYDVGYLYDFGTVGQFTLQLADAFKPDLASAYQKIEAKIEKAIDKMITAYEEIED